jgi:ribosome maturation factor RimP
MNSFKENIVEIAKEISTANGFFLIDVIIRGTERNRVIEVFIDGERNITAEDCAEISRNINRILEEKEMIDYAYRLDVSSPGIDKPLIYPEQYPKHINREFEITYYSGENKRKYKGTLIKVDGQALTFSSDRELIINFNDIINAKVLVSFS